MEAVGGVLGAIDLGGEYVDACTVSRTWVFVLADPGRRNCTVTDDRQYASTPNAVRCRYAGD